MKTHKLEVEKRKITGRKVKTLRLEGFVPANIFGKDVKSLSVQMKLIDFNKTLKEAGETSIIELLLGKDKRAVLINNVQYDPITDKPIHVDFHQVNLKEKTTADVPIVLIGESLAEKQGLGTAVQYLNEVEVEALPLDLPEKFEVDISKLNEVDSAILVKDLDYDKSKIELKGLDEDPIVKVEALRKEEEVKPVEEESDAEVVDGEEEKEVSDDSEKKEESSEEVDSEASKKEEEKKS